MSEANLQECLEYSDEMKSEGNDHFRARKWDEALVAYRSALGRLPKRPEKTKQTPSEDLDDKEVQKVEPEQEEPLSELDIKCAKARSVLNANIGACFVQLDDHKAVVEACSQALLDDPQYIKALQRRASSNEKIDSWSSLTAAQEDYNVLLKLLPSSSPQLKDIERSLTRLKPRIEAAQKKETAEMMGKFKDLGNKFLGNFGLSTDNFKFEPNGQGGYSVNFGR